MQPIFFTVFAVCFAPAPKAVMLEDGFYEIRSSGEGTHFPCNDGRTLILGKHLGKEFGKALIYSRNNENTQFGATLRGAAKLWDGPEPLVIALVVDNVCLRLSGNSIPNKDDTRDLWFHIQGAEPARRVAKGLKCDLGLRKDPDHRFKVKWTTEKESYTVGEPIVLNFELKNDRNADFTVRIGGSQRGPRDNQFRFVAQSWSGGGKGIPDTGDPNNFGGISWTKTLKPGEVYTAKVDISKWFKLEEAGTYRVTGIWELHLEDAAHGSFDRGIWDDLVCGECLVTVVKAKK